MPIEEILTKANDAPEYWEVLGHYVEHDEDIIRDGHEFVLTVDGVRHAIDLEYGRFVVSENWTDIIPAIPLARGVPVIDKTTKLRGVTAVTAGRLVVKFDQVEGWVDADSTFVDLGDPQGFAYALRYWAQHHDDESGEAEEQALQWALSYLGDGITDADRVALAKALKEVTS